MIELTVLINELRRQLIAASTDAADEELRLGLGTIELEATIVASKEDEGSAKVRFWVVEAGGGLKGSNSSTQRIKLTLQPAIAGSQVRPWVSGQSDHRER